MADLRDDASDPFDLSKALAGAAAGRLDPEVSRFHLHAEYDMAGDQQVAIDKIYSQLENSQDRCILLGVTGSGKTFAMAFAAGKLRQQAEMDAPTIVIVLDRLDLIQQTHAEFSSIGISGLRVAETKKHLRRLLRDDARGVIITMIHRNVLLRYYLLRPRTKRAPPGQAQALEALRNRRPGCH